MNYNFYRILEENFAAHCPVILWSALLPNIWLTIIGFFPNKEGICKNCKKPFNFSDIPIHDLVKGLSSYTTAGQVYIFCHVDVDIYCFEFLMHGFLLSWLIYNLLNKSWRQWRMKHNLLPSYIKQPLPHLLPSLWWGQWLSTLSSSHSSLPVTPICHFLPFTKNWKWYVSLRNYADN